MGEIEYARHPFRELSEPPLIQRSRPRGVEGWRRGKRVYGMLGRGDGIYEIVAGTYLRRLEPESEFHPQTALCVIEIRGRYVVVAAERLFEGDQMKMAGEEARRWNEFVRAFYLPVSPKARVSLPRAHFRKDQELRVPELVA